MPDLRERFIELAVRPLAGKAPAEDLARGEVMERLNHSRPGSKDDSLETATARLESTGGHLLKSGRQILLLLVVFTVVLGAVGWWSWKDLVRIDCFYNVIPGQNGPFRAAERELEAKVPDDRRLFLFANSERMGDDVRETWRESCELSLPDDPAWLEDYVAVTGFGNRAQRDKILEKARRIDSGNGLWDLREAGSRLASSKFQFILSRPRSGIGPVLPVLITDPSFHEAVALVETAASAPRFESWIPSRMTERVEMLGRATNMAELADRLMFIENQRGIGMYFYRWAEFWEIRAQELERNQDREGLRRWFETFERFQSRCLKEPGDVRLYQMVREFLISRGARTFSGILSRAGLADESARLDHWIQEFRRSIPSAPSGVEDLFRKAAVPARGEWVYYQSSVGLVHHGELEPIVRAEHAMADRMFGVAVAILFGVLAWLAALEGWRRALSVRGLADGMAILLRPSDFAWICALGIVLPAAWHVAVELSPLGCRDYTIAFGNMMPFAMRVGGSFIFAACMLVQSARWRLAKRGGVLGFRPALWQGWAVAVIAALFVPAVGIVRYLTKGQEEFLTFGSAVAGLPLLWLLWRAFALILCPRQGALPGVIVCRMLVPSFVAASLVLLGAAPLLEREESKWVQRDTLSHPDPARGGMPVVEGRLAGMLREKMLRAIDTAPAAK